MNLDPQAPLGVFDSGLGGLTVVRQLIEILPGESIVYLGDTARVPYGTRSADTVIRYARGCAKMLLSRGIKALVVACNTVSAVAVDLLRAELDLPVIGVVEPGARAAVQAMQGMPAPCPGAAARIGVLGTAGTIASGAYPRAVSKYSTRFEVTARSAPLLVPLVEEGWLEGPVPEMAVQRYAAPLLEAGASVIVLGCTHYPLLRPTIERVTAGLAGRLLPIVDSAEATAREVAEQVAQGRIARAPGDRPGTLELLVTDLPGSFESVAARFLGGSLPPVRQVDLIG